MIEGEAEEEDGCPADFACGFCRHKFCQQSLQDHIKIDHLNYFPYKCMQPNCFDHFSSEEIFDLHCDAKHDGEKRIYVQTDKTAEKLCGMILAEHADNPFKRSKRLITAYLDRKSYQRALYQIYQLNKKWLENLHLPDGSKKAAEILRYYLPGVSADELQKYADTGFFDYESLQRDSCADFKEKGHLGFCYVCQVTGKARNFLHNRENFDYSALRDDEDSVPCQQDALRELRKLMNPKDIGLALLANLKCAKPEESPYDDDHATQCKRKRVKRQKRRGGQKNRTFVSRPPYESATTSASSRERASAAGKLICKLCGHQSRSKTITQHWRQHVPTETGVDWLFACLLCCAQKKAVKSLYLDSIQSHLFSAHHLKEPYQLNVHYESREHELGHVMNELRWKCYGK